MEEKQEKVEPPKTAGASRRVLKFRVWRDGMMHQKRVMEWESLGFYLGGGDGAIPMQWTGLQDKNGRDIYEGDILKSLAGINMVVRFCDGEFEAVTGQISIDRYAWREREVVGNIYENPELVK